MTHINWIIPMNIEKQKSDVLFYLTKELNNVHAFAKEHEYVIAQYHVIDFWEKWDGVFKKENNGNFYEFALELFDLANARASDTIKLYFDHKDFPLDYDGENSSHALYILAKGEFNGQEYFVKATSEHKYHNDNYVFDKTMHRG